MLLALTSLALACGPAHAETLARTAESRVYSSGGVVYGCHRDRSRPLRIGTGVLGVTLAGRRAVVRRRYPPGEQLRMYDLRRGLTKEHVEEAGTFETVRVERAGTAAYVVLLPDGDRVIGTIRRDVSVGPSRAFVPGSLRLAASTIAWREGATVHVLRAKDTVVPETPLVALGDVQISVRGYALAARRGDGPRRVLGGAIGPCGTSGGCSGIGQLQAAGSYVAALFSSWDRSSDFETLLVRDLERGGVRRRCNFEPGGSMYTHQVAAFVLSASGGVACATVSGTLRRIRTADTVLDEGPGIVPESLTRRGDRIVWLHDGVERSAPLP